MVAERASSAGGRAPERRHVSTQLCLRQVATPNATPRAVAAQVRQGLSDALEAEVAHGVGFHPYKLSDEEQEALPGSFDEGVYCVVRNHVLAKWRTDVSRPLSEEAACSQIMWKHQPIVRAAFRFLASRGYINFGLAARRPPPRDAPGSGAGGSGGSGNGAKASVVIVGAGLAGLAAARQLVAAGHKVVLVEARDRAGGRVHSARLGDGDCAAVADLGGSVITGAEGNPLAVVARQLAAQWHVIRGECPLYFADGCPLPLDTDEKVGAQFNSLLDHCSEFRDNVGASAAGSLSLGRAMDLLSAEHGIGTDPQERCVLDWHLANLEYANAGLVESLSLGQWDQDDPWEMVRHSASGRSRSPAPLLCTPFNAPPHSGLRRWGTTCCFRAPTAGWC